jgi:hypothetical protein
MRILRHSRIKFPLLSNSYLPVPKRGLGRCQGHSSTEKVEGLKTPRSARRPSDGRNNRRAEHLPKRPPGLERPSYPKHEAPSGLGKSHHKPIFSPEGAFFEYPNKTLARPFRAGEWTRRHRLSPSPAPHNPAPRSGYEPSFRPTRCGDKEHREPSLTHCRARCRPRRCW